MYDRDEEGEGGCEPGADGAQAAPEAARGFPFRDSGRGAGRAKAALATWSVLEALSPRTYVEANDLVDDLRDLDRFDDPRGLPWPDLEPARDGYAIYYRFDLGAIDMRRATSAILDAYGTDEGVVAPRGGKAILAMGVVDHMGAPVARGFSVSSFGWALPLVLGKSLAGMERWGEVEQDVLSNLVNQLSTPVDDLADGPPRLAGITREGILAAHAWLVRRLGIPPEFVEPPAFSIRFEHRKRANSTPSAFLLNSFFLPDLDRAQGLVEEGMAPPALRAYLGLDVPAKPIDVLRGRGALRHLLAPGRHPAARWPVPGGHALATLQQAAVNAAVSGLGGTEGLLAVNGPPGTGKTTLLRDVVAAAVLRRAGAMVRFANPEDAFTREEGSSGPYTLAPGLTGDEVMVASSNNKAVENVSGELPLLRAVEGGEDGEGGPRHFRALADFVAGAIGKDGRPGDPSKATWGLAAAVMGSAGNRSRFMNRFWWNEDYGLRTWLRLARGENVQVQVYEDKKVVGNRPPHLLKVEQPPRSRAEARERWGAARERFIARRAEILGELGRLDRYDDAVQNLGDWRSDLERAEAALSKLEAAARPVDALAMRHAKAMEDHDALAGEVERHRAYEPRRPGDGGGRAAWDIWDAEREEMEHRLEGAARTLARIGAALDAEREAGADDGGILAARRDARLLRDLVDEGEALVAEVRAQGAPLRVDEDFFAAGHGVWNVATPWLGERIQALRSELFGLAMAVHEAFALAAARPLLKNIGAYSELTGSAGASPTLTAQAANLWSSLFLVVPVVSTTFASAGRMLNYLPPASLGWLVVDEAGQATPQSAVGAVTRFRRVVAVGDPLQVEPVVTLPRRLAGRICEHFGVGVDAWIAPSASVQTLADAASPLKATYDTMDGERAVGMPLLVHRRCREPMFSISNRVAYSGQMVHATAGGEPGPAAGRIGESAWFDVDGAHDGKWCAAQGDAVAALLARAAAGGDGSPIPGGPDVYVITPFREVAARLRLRVRAEPGIFKGADAKAWADERIGTIHTFQGREAEAVVLVLGAGEAGHAGARAWAGRTPNIANVAVTRARHALYVVGARAAWEAAGTFAAVAGSLPVRALPAAPPGTLRAPPKTTPTRRLAGQAPVTAGASVEPPPPEAIAKAEAESEARLLAAIDLFEDLGRLGR